MRERAEPPGTLVCDERDKSARAVGHCPGPGDRRRPGGHADQMTVDGSAECPEAVSGEAIPSEAAGGCAVLSLDERQVLAVRRPGRPRVGVAGSRVGEPLLV